MPEIYIHFKENIHKTQTSAASVCIDHLFISTEVTRGTLEHATAFGHCTQLAPQQHTHEQTHRHTDIHTRRRDKKEG